MMQTFWLFVAVVFLCGAADVQGQDVATLEGIDCSDASAISFSIDIPDIAEWGGAADQSLWALNGVPGCEPTFDQGGGLVTYTGIDAATCDQGGLSSTDDRSKFEYEFVITVLAQAGSTISPATYAYDHNYVVKCFYNRQQENIMASFQPRHSLSDSGSGVEDFTIDFTIHLVSDPGTEVDPSDVLDLNTAAFGKLEITGLAGVSENLDVHLRSVTADNDNSPGGEFALITDGCAASNVVTGTTCDTNADDTFNFNVFRFPGQNTGDLVYLKATVIVCLTSSVGSVCKTECNACINDKRKRRDTLEQIQQTEFYVTAGPFKVRDPDQESGAAVDKDEETGLPAYVIAVVAVCSLLAVAIVSAVVLIVFRRRRQNVANVELQNEDSVTA